MSISIVGIGGSVDPDSQSERALRAVLSAAREQGARTAAFTGRDFELPMYHSEGVLPPAARPLVEAVRAADALVISSPGYHGTVSGMVKNALDHLEELRHDARPYLDGRAVGTVAVASGGQAAATTMATLRQVVHALRGWPTPLGIAINSAETKLAADGTSDDPQLARQVQIMAGQLIDFAEAFAAR